MRPETYLFTEDHEWVSISDGIASVGITDYAGSELGDVVYVDLPEVGKKVTKGESMFTVESVKAVSDIYAPLSGEIATMAKVAATVNIAPSKSGSNCLGVNFQGFCGVFTIMVWLITLLPSRFINNGIS